MKKFRRIASVPVALMLSCVLMLGMFSFTGCAKTFTVTFETNGGTAAAAQKVEEGSTIDLPSTTREGYVLDGWFDNRELTGTPVTSPYKPTADVRLYAKWSENSYTIKFVSNEGTPVEDQKVVRGSELTLPTTTREGYVFDGWFDNEQCTGTPVAAPYIPTANGTLYAKWTEDVREKYTVKFVSNGGINIADASVAEGDSLTLPKQERNDYVFDGWFDNEQCTGTALGATITPTASITLYAKWSKDNYQRKDDGKSYTYRTYTSVSPSDWSDFTQHDENDRQINSWIKSPFFEFDFKFDAAGKIVPGDFEVEYSAATSLEDVTEQYAGQYGIPEGTKNYRAWKIGLRNDLKWNDGTAIDATDFVWSMQQLLDPLFMNQNASQYYGGNYIIHNAREYVYQGQSGWFDARGFCGTYTEALDSGLIFSLSGATENKDRYEGASSYFKNLLDDQIGQELTLNQAISVMQQNWFTDMTAEALAAHVNALEGKTYAEIKASDSLKESFALILGFWQTEPEEVLDFFVTHGTYPTLDFSKVGVFAPSKYELVVVYDNEMSLTDELGNLSYEAAYYMSDLPLVHKDLYETNKKAPATGSTLLTSTYNKDVASTASWGPYKLTSFQVDKEFTLEKNPNWYGWNMRKYDGQYQTTKIVTTVVKEWETAWQDFQLGKLDGVGINVTIADRYKTAERAYFTPDELTASVHVQSSYEALKKNESEGINKTILAQDDFRKALSLSINRDEYARTCTTSSLKGLGFFNSMHYYDVAHGGLYRETDVAKKVLIEVYGGEIIENSDGSETYKVGIHEFDDLDEAVDALTGYDLTLARKLVDSAYDKAKAAGDIKDTDKVVIKFGTSSDDESSRRHYNFLKDSFEELVKGTKLEGRLEIEFDGSYGATWSTAFRSGAYEIAPASGFSGGAWNPYYFIGSEVNKNEPIRYASAWDTTKENITIKIDPEVAAECESKYNNEEEITKSIQDWHDSLNGISGASANYSLAPESTKLLILAALEKAALNKCYSIPTFYAYGASLMGFKVDYITYEYNTFMSYGGVQYMTYKYDDVAWDAFVAAQPGGKLDYSK